MDMQSAIALGVACVAAIGWYVTFRIVNARLNWLDQENRNQDLAVSLELNELRQELHRKGQLISLLMEEVGSLRADSALQMPGLEAACGAPGNNASSSPSNGKATRDLGQ